MSEKTTPPAKIKLFKENPFDLGREQFDKLELAEKLAKKYEPKPYEEENRELYVIAGGVSYFCNAASIVTASTFVFAAVLAKLNKLPYAFLIAAVIALAVLVCVEHLQRKQAPKFFEQAMLKGFTFSVGRRGLFLLLLSAFSLFCSYFGGFDFAATVAKDEPEMIAPVQLSEAEITSRYDKQIADAKAAAREYRTRRLYKGKLSIADGNKWRNLLAVATNKEKEMNAALVETQRLNQSNRVQAKAEHTQALAQHAAKIQDNGGGLSTFAIFAQALFFLCVWYREKYEFETAKQYASVQVHAGHSGHSGRTARTDSTDASRTTRTKKADKRKADAVFNPDTSGVYADISRTGPDKSETSVRPFSLSARPTCHGCGSDISGRKEGAKWCGDACRKRAKRSK